MLTIILRYSLALLAGGLSAYSFAPVGIYPLSILGLAILFSLLARGGTLRPFLTGWLYGLGLFGVGVSWIYVSLHVYGGMSLALALSATILFCSIFALFPALLGIFSARFNTNSSVRILLIMPAAWTLLEWTRGWLFTGFPWLSLGYSQVPSSPLAGYAPVLGVFGVSFAAAFSAALLAWLWRMRLQSGRLLAGSMLLLALLGGGQLLKQVSWTYPLGSPFSVALIQGNIPQELKWNPEVAASTLQTYKTLISESRARLVVLPETALPVFYSELPESYVADIRAMGKSQGGDILAGVPTGSPSGPYLNSVASFGTQPTQFYSKHHLVPFGEFIPPGFHWVVDILHIPLSDFSRGGAHQPPLNVAGQKVAVNICYEDAFGEEIIRALPQATLLVNVSNDAWFGNSFAARQHRQISQMRALETGRMMLRATNTGSTAIIDPTGHVISELPLFKRGVLWGTAQGYAGVTPYVRWGNWPIISASFLILAFSVWRGLRRQH